MNPSPPLRIYFTRNITVRLIRIIFVIPTKSTRPKQFHKGEIFSNERTNGKIYVNEFADGRRYTARKTPASILFVYSFDIKFTTQGDATA